MGRAFSGDLRVRIAAAYERGEGSCRVLARSFGVGWEYVRKVRRQQLKTGNSTRPAQSCHGVRSRVTDEVKTHMLALVKEQPDITIAELRQKIEAEKGVSMSWSPVQLWMGRLRLRLKKSRSMPASATAKPTASSARSSSRASARSLRNT
jgi:transposase